MDSIRPVRRKIGNFSTISAYCSMSDGMTWKSMCDIENIDGIRDGIIGMKDEEIHEEKKGGHGLHKLENTWVVAQFST